MVYTHNWGALPLCRARRRDGRRRARAAARCSHSSPRGVALLYLPWMPTLLFQARHTGAPWSTRAELPRRSSLAPGAVLSGDAPFVAFVRRRVAALVSFLRRGRERGAHDRPRARARRGRHRARRVDRRRRSRPRGRRATSRSCSAPLLLLAARGDRARPARSASSRSSRRLPLVGLHRHDDKENAREIAARLAPSLHPGELVISTHPGAGAGAALLPRRRACGSRRRSGRCRTRRSSTGATRSTACGRLSRSRRSTGCSRRAVGQRVRRHLAGLPRLPRLERASGRGSCGGSRRAGRGSSSATRGCGSSRHIAHERDRGRSATTSSRCRRSSIASALALAPGSARPTP